VFRDFSPETDPQVNRDSISGKIPETQKQEKHKRNILKEEKM